MITNNVSSSGDFQIQNHIYGQDESKLTHYEGIEEKPPQTIMSEEANLEKSTSMIVYMQQDLSESKSNEIYPYEDSRQIVKNTCVGTDELELLMLEDQQNIDSLSSHVSNNSAYQQFEVLHNLGTNRYVIVEKNQKRIEEVVAEMESSEYGRTKANVSVIKESNDKTCE